MVLPASQFSITFGFQILFKILKSLSLKEGNTYDMILDGSFNLYILINLNNCLCISVQSAFLPANSFQPSISNGVNLLEDKLLVAMQ